ncbi:MAG: hypothetical protein AB7F89_04710 [Pirellulaceae bacterium]
MREFFFYALAGTLTVVLAGWALYMLGRALAQLLSDWRLGRELDELEADGAARREKRQQQLEQRLANGCEHDFASGAIGLPPEVCIKCGLEKNKPSGPCDHIWRVKSGAVPTSSCEICGKIYHPLQPAPDLRRR